ncbi:MAG: hypothetical protein QME12_06375 [Nanoarchaeota archaeon]|nr:hypothetical protein [Nanoarchaeota archaeon]
MANQIKIKGEDAMITAMLDEARIVKNYLGKPKKAIKLCDEILKISPSNKDALLIKAGALGKLFELNKSDEILSFVMQRYPGDWEAYWLYAGHCFALGKDEKALEMIDKSLELRRTFDNVISKAQHLHLMGKGGYAELIAEAAKMDKKRAENFMKKHWINDLDDVKPSFWEKIKVIREVFKNDRRKQSDSSIN